MGGIAKRSRWLFMLVSSIQNNGKDTYLASSIRTDHYMFVLDHKDKAYLYDMIKDPGQKEDINTIAQPNFLAVLPELPEETVYLITKTIYENLPFLHNIHKATKAMSLERAINGLPAPLHAGAAKYYREKGIKIPASLQPK